MIDSTWRRLRRIVSGGPADVDDELAFHRQMRVDEFMASGMSRAEAERAANAKFGEHDVVRTTLVGIDARRRRRLDWRDRLDTLASDVSVSLRALRREPLFTAGVVLTIALGIGANATMFGIIDGLMLRGPAHVVDARRVQRLYVTTQSAAFGARTDATVGYVSYALLRDHAKTLSAFGAYTPAWPTRLGDGDRTVPTASATWDFFRALGVIPVVGHFFTREEDDPTNTARVAVISDALWRSDFGGDASALGKPISLGGEQYTIIGVAPNGFAGTDRVRTDVWLPMSLIHPNDTWTTTYNAQWLRVVARLAPGATAQQASVEATTILRAGYTGDETSMRKLDASLRPIWFGRGGEVSPTVNVARWLMAVAVVVLLVTCANVANLLIARARRRRREVAVRLALGAGRARMIRLLATETMLVVFGGALAAAAIAAAGGKIMRATLLSELVWEGTILDVRVFAFTLGLAIVVGLALGVLPALDATRADLTSALKSGTRDGGGQRAGLRSALSAIQAALCVILLVGAGLFIRSLQRSQALDLGFQPNQLIRAYPRLRVDANADGEAAKSKTRNRERLSTVVERLRKLPWVENAALSVGSPLGNRFSVSLRVPGRDSIPHVGDSNPRITAGSSEYFATVGTPLRAGRLFTAADRAGSAPVTIVNETMARTLWPNESALGKCLIVGGNSAQTPCFEIVGVVADVHLSGLRDKPSMQYYVPFGQEVGIGGTTILIRARDTNDHLGDARRAFRDMPDMDYTSVESVREALDPEFRPWRLGAAMFGVFGVVALIVAAVGLYSVIAYLVADRTRELGVRIALGATTGRVVADVLRGAATVAAIGVGLGVAITMAAGRFVEPLLFNVSPRDPSVIGVVAAIVLLIAVAAAWIPARRASRVDPMVALRDEG